MFEIVLTLAVSSTFLIAVLAFLPAKQHHLRPVRVRRDAVRRCRR